MELMRPEANNSIVKQIILQVEEALVNRELKSGDKFPSESNLIKNLGVSKVSVREAVKMLEALGVLEVRRGEGTFIRSQPSTDIINPMLYSLLLEQPKDNDILDLRLMFEPAYTVMAMNNATDEDLIIIKNLLTLFHQKILDQTYTVEDDLNFHRAILEATHNKYVIRIGFLILKVFKVSINNSVHKVPETALNDHLNIYEALLMKNEAQLRKCVIDSFNGWIENMK